MALSCRVSVAVTTEDPVQVVSQLVGNQASGSEGSTVSKLSRRQLDAAVIDTYRFDPGS